jgi:hypothetical protein
MLQQSVKATSIQCLSQRWKKCVIMKETLWKNNLNFVKDVPMIYVNFITILIVVFESKIGGCTLVLTFILMINCMVPTPSLLFTGYQGIFPRG